MIQRLGEIIFLSFPPPKRPLESTYTHLHTLCLMVGDHNKVWIVTAWTVGDFARSQHLDVHTVRENIWRRRLQDV